MSGTPSRPWVVLIMCLLAHALLAHLIASPWWVPDLTLVGLVLVVSAASTHWLIASVIAGLFIMAWAGRFPAQGFLSYVLCGAIVQLAARRWDTTDARVQGVVVVGASVALTLGLLWVEGLWSVPILGLAAVRIALTALSLPLARRLCVR